MSAATPNWNDKIPDWAKGLPLPRSNPEHISASEVAELVSTKQAGVDFVVVDLRKADWEVRHIHDILDHR